MENETGKRVGPPPVLAAVMETLVPAAARKGNDGDWRESYISPRQYVCEIVRSIPVMVTAQVRRTFNPMFVLGEAAILFLSFGGAPAVPFAIVSGVTLGILILRDAYIRPDRRSYLDAVPHAIMASTVIVFSQIVLGMTAPSLTMPYLTAIRGASLSMILMSAWRLIFFLNRPPAVPPLTARAYREAWRLNILWMVASMGLLHSNVHAVPAVFPGRDLLLGLMPMMTLSISHWLQMRTPEGIARIVTPLSIRQDPLKNELAIRQQKVMAPQKKPPSGVGWAVLFEILFFVVLAWPSGSAFLRWFAVDPAAALIDWPLEWTNLGAMLPLSGAWIYVKRTNRRTAQQIQEDIDALNEEETK